MTIQIQATGVIINPRCPPSRNPQYPPRTYFDLQTEANGKLTFSIEHDHTPQLKDLGLRAVKLTAEVRGQEWQGNQRLQILKMKLDEMGAPEPAKS